ncbi:formimidoylglutamase [Amphritea sp. HPY]|uniref:formimidoylglutamase n=1 Tax=Amphritea sp. HPY TaxID=3421652 RepID=UPI003D7CDF57
MSESGSEFEFNDIWSGRVDAEEGAGLATRLHQVISPLDSAPVGKLGLALIGFCSDEGVRRNQGRVGARHAPDQLRRSLANLPWPMDRPAYDAGNVICEGEKLDEAQQALGSRVSDCLAQGHFPFVLGGGHEMAFGSWLGLSRYCAAQKQMPRIGIINFDAHFDLRLDSYGGSSGTPFYQIAQQCQQQNYDFRYCCLGVSEISNTAALFQRADQLGVCYRKDAELGITRLAETIDLLQNFIAGCDLLYLTIDLDVLPAYIAPGVSAPAARGVGLDVLEPLIEAIAGSGKLRLADIAEYNPNFDIDNRTARVVARLFHRIVKRGYKHD